MDFDNEPERPLRDDIRLLGRLLGDTVRFTARDPLRLVITGRTRHFVNAFGENCNVQYGEYQSVFDRCERPGDRLKLDGGGINAGQVEIG